MMGASHRRPAADVYRALVVDDEALAREHLLQALARHPQWRCVGACATLDAARQALDTQAPQLVLLDIRMPGLSGLDWAREMRERDAQPCVVFVTAHDGHALEAFEAHALDYLLKPFDSARFARVLQRVEQTLQLHQAALRALGSQTPGGRGVTDPAAHATPDTHTLTVRSVGRVERIDVADIEWISGAGNYATLHLGQREVLHRATLTSLEQHLPAGEFVRVHRTALVRRKAAASLTTQCGGGHTLCLRSGARVPISDTYLAEARALFG